MFYVCFYYLRSLYFTEYKSLTAVCQVSDSSTKLEESPFLDQGQRDTKDVIGHFNSATVSHLTGHMTHHMIHHMISQHNIGHMTWHHGLEGSRKVWNNDSELLLIHSSISHPMTSCAASWLILWCHAQPQQVINSTCSVITANCSSHRTQVQTVARSTTVRPLVWGCARLVSALRRRPLVQQLADYIFFIFIVFFIVTPLLIAYRLVNCDRSF